MTVRETINTIRLMLDDGWDWYQGFEYVRKAINEAQLRVLEKAIVTNDEKCLRPLYRRIDGIFDRRNINASPSDGIVIFENGFMPRFIHTVRACLVSITNDPVPNNIKFMQQAQYQPLQTFLNYESVIGPYFDNVGNFIQNRYAHSLYYTVERDEKFFGYVTNMMFTNGMLANAVATLSAIVYPWQFDEQQELELPQEYHFEVCALAAELINNADVGEQMRGQTARAEFGQKLNIDTTSSIRPQSQQGKQQ